MQDMLKPGFVYSFFLKNKKSIAPIRLYMLMQTTEIVLSPMLNSL